MKKHHIIITILLLNSAVFASNNYPDGGGTSADGFSWSSKVPKAVEEKAPMCDPSKGEIPLLPGEAYQKALAAFTALGLQGAVLWDLSLNVGRVGGPPAYHLTLIDKYHHGVGFIIFLNGVVISPHITKK